MTAAIVLAVTSTFAFKAKTINPIEFSFKAGTTCYWSNGGLDQTSCHELFTGAQCTFSGFLAYYYDMDASLPPTCTIPLRRF